MQRPLRPPHSATGTESCVLPHQHERRSGCFMRLRHSVVGALLFVVLVATRRAHLLRACHRGSRFSRICLSENCLQLKSILPKTPSRLARLARNYLKGRDRHRTNALLLAAGLQLLPRAWRAIFNAISTAPNIKSPQFVA